MTDNNSVKETQGLSITSLDGRNYLKVKDLSDYFSEFSLFKYRIKVEIAYFKKLSEWNIIRRLSATELVLAKNLTELFDINEFKKIKEIEKKVNHDVKAVEYYLKNKFIKTSLKDLIPYIHFGLTSEDTNNLSYGLILKDFKEKILEKEIVQLTDQLNFLAKKWSSVSILGRTHGQPAVPTTVGKEIANYVYRLRKQIKKLKQFKFEGKCNGAVGNLNVLKTVLPEKNWLKLSSDFVLSLGLNPNLYTTQILFYDNYLEFFQIIFLINGILYDFCINIWHYIMMNVFIQKNKDKEVGSSTMPQKINPIYFENAEGNLGLANSMFQFFERKLIHSRLQRDLSDSTIRRNFGESLGYSILAWRNIKLGLERIFLNENHLKQELNDHWEILTEAIQIVLRLKGDSIGYDKVKDLIRGKTMNKEEYFKLLNDLGLENNKKLKDLTPEKYFGYAIKLVEKL